MRIFILFSILLISNYAFSQKLELGKVTIEELKQKNHAIDPNASAAIIFSSDKLGVMLLFNRALEKTLRIIGAFVIYKPLKSNIWRPFIL